MPFAPLDDPMTLCTNARCEGGLLVVSMSARVFPRSSRLQWRCRGRITGHSEKACRRTISWDLCPECRPSTPRPHPAQPQRTRSAAAARFSLAAAEAASFVAQMPCDNQCNQESAERCRTRHLGTRVRTTVSWRAQAGPVYDRPRLRRGLLIHKGESLRDLGNGRNKVAPVRT
jgi:hypothetical protein